MARIRTIKPEFWTDERLGECSTSARLLFIATWTFADDYGNLQRSAKQLKAQAFPYDTLDCEPLVQELLGAGLIVEYEADGKNYLHINNFNRHQKIDRPSKMPRCPLYDDSRGLDEPSLSTRPVREGKVREGKVRKITLDWPSVDNLDLDWWLLWLAHRRAERRPPYKTTRTAQMLARFPMEVQRAAIEQSMDQNWQGLFPQKVRLNGSGRTDGETRSRYEQHTERLRKWLDDQRGVAA